MVFSRFQEPFQTRVSCLTPARPSGSPRYWCTWANRVFRESPFESLSPRACHHAPGDGNCHWQPSARVSVNQVCLDQLGCPRGTNMVASRPTWLSERPQSGMPRPTWFSERFQFRGASANIVVREALSRGARPMWLSEIPGCEASIRVFRWLSFPEALKILSLKRAGR